MKTESNIKKTNNIKDKLKTSLSSTIFKMSKSNAIYFVLFIFSGLSKYRSKFLNKEIFTTSTKLEIKKRIDKIIN